MKSLVYIVSEFEDSINFGSLCESILFYEKVILVTNGYSFAKMIFSTGYEKIAELVKSNCLDVYITENCLGIGVSNMDQRVVFHSFIPEVFDFFDEAEYPRTNIEIELKNGFENLITNKNHNEINDYVEQALKISKPFRFPYELSNHVESDLTDYNYFKKVYSKINTFDGAVLSGLGMIGDKSGYKFSPSSEIYDLDDAKINPTKAIFQILRARENLFISSFFQSDIICSPIESDIINTRCIQTLKKINTRQREIDMFQEYVFNGLPNISKAINGGLISFKEYLNVLRKSDKFKNWLSKYDYEDKLLTEYINEILKGSKFDSLHYKIGKWVFFTGIGFAIDAYIGSEGIATSMGLGISIADTFLLDNLSKNWKPNQFIDSELRKIYNAN